mmetsp:Transcript_23218/g.39867  ORF Transcript_23218/g.39867 Transcript_23218/m.39867 type:complete len:342 (-) Transcript_23218:10798-11823(-)
MAEIRKFSDIRADRNPADSWYNKNAVPGGPKKHAFLRLQEPTMVVHHKPKFTLSKDMSFFLIGSCFARGLERILSIRGLDVRSVSSEFDNWETQYEKGSALGTTNRYNTASILNEFHWNVETDTGLEASTLIQKSDGLYFDPHATQTIAPGSLDDQMARRSIWSRMCSEIARVDVVVITLGLVEVWYDRETGVYMNAAPDPRLAAQYPDRFEFHILNYNDNMDNLERIYAILKGRNPGAKIILTVSPVPLLKTFSGQDVVIANTYSKNTLRAVAGDFVRGKPDADYFPSYEIAMHSDRSIVWKEDQRHVNGPFSREIMNQFLGHYLSEHIDTDDYDLTELA